LELKTMRRPSRDQIAQFSSASLAVNFVRPSPSTS
jgi:hypothetical protein